MVIGSSQTVHFGGICSMLNDFYTDFDGNNFPQISQSLFITVHEDARNESGPIISDILRMAEVPQRSV